MSPRFRILGPLEVEGVSSLGGPKQRALLARLVVERGRIVPKEQLVDDLWPEDPPETAAHALHVYVSTLRRSLGPGRLHADRGGYRLEVSADEVDAARFERLAGDGARLLERGEPDAARSLLEQALALWRGPALGGAGGTFAAERARLDAERLTALERRIEADLALGRHEALVGELEALVGEHPLREGFRRQLMLALYRSGRQADALAVYRAARRALREGLGLDPGRELRELERAILRHDPALAVEPAQLRERRHLPAPTTPLVGRRREVDALLELLRDPARLVTLTGPGGTGKTRLALQAAHELADRFPDGVYFVDLAPLRDPALVADAIARALALPEEPARTQAGALAAYLRDRRLLLVLDNFEHVHDAAPLVAELLASAPDLRVLVTSRAALRLYGEHEYEVGPLSLEEEAVPLFVARARAVAPGFRDADPVAAVCLRLDRLPLAIELAAARVRDVSLGEMLVTLPRLELAAAGPRDRAPRQQTLRAAIAWSVDLLDERLRSRFARLAVFLGGWSPDAATAVAGASRADLEALTRHSLVQDDGQRFSLLETIREYALERLRESGEHEDVARRHAEHFLAVGEEAGPAVNEGRDQVQWLDRLEREHDNFRGALTWAVERGDGETALRLAVALSRFWEWRGHVREGARWFGAALALEASDEIRVRALLRASALVHLQGDLAGARDLGERTLELARRRGDAAMTANALRKLATIAKDAGAHARAADLHEQALAVSRAAGDRRGVASSLVNLADLALTRGDHVRATELADEGLGLARELGDPMHEMVALINLGLAKIVAERPREAAKALGGALEMSANARYRDGLAFALEGLAAVASAEGEDVAALRLTGAAEALLAETGVALEAVERSLHERTLAAARRRLGAAGAAREHAAGTRLSFEQAVAAGREVARTAHTADRADRTPASRAASRPLE